MFCTCLLLITPSSGRWAGRKVEVRPCSDGLLLCELQTLKEKQEFLKTPEMHLHFSAKNNCISGLKVSASVCFVGAGCHLGAASLIWFLQA